MHVKDESLDISKSRIRNWLHEHAFPIWLHRAWDPSDGFFYDELSALDVTHLGSRKRLRVLARQIYVCAYACRQGYDAARPVLSGALTCLFERCKRKDGAYLSHFDMQGRPTSDHVDTYDLAFVIFALAEAFSLLREDYLASEAAALLNYIERHLKNDFGGYDEGIPPTLPRRQNPHMHLFEACVAWIGLGPCDAFETQANKLYELFLKRFYCSETGSVIEFFNEDWSRFSAAEEICEPGHHYEWCWLLSEYSLRTGASIPILPDLYRRSRAASNVTAQGILLAATSPDGVGSDEDVRLWPHAERLKAESYALASPQLRSDDHLSTALATLWAFLDVPVTGFWCEKYSITQRRFIAAPSPTSTLYHLVSCFQKFTTV